MTLDRQPWQNYRLLEPCECVDLCDLGEVPLFYNPIDSERQPQPRTLLLNLKIDLFAFSCRRPGQLRGQTTDIRQQPTFEFFVYSSPAQKTKKRPPSW